jgi:HTH-type transcriptional regulator/antitoxin HigA
MKTTLIVVENDKDHAEAMALMERLMTSDDPRDVARLRAQARLIEDYERARWPRIRPTLPDLLAYLMDQHGLTRADLVPLLGTASRVSEVLNGKRGLSLAMVRRLGARFRVPADLLIAASPRKGRDQKSRRKGRNQQSRRPARTRQRFATAAE